MTTLAPTLIQPLADLNAWTAHFRAAYIPVLAATAEALEAMRACEDNVDANLIGEMVSGDPLMTLKILAHAATHRRSRMVTDTETVTSTLVMMGISPFFRAFGPQTTVQQQLGAEPEALAGLQATVRRAHRSANFALGFAVHRHDRDAAVIHQAALLHDFGEMLMWCHAPGLALKVQQAQQADGALRSSVVQREVLNVELAALQLALMKAWRLPELLVQLGDPAQARQARVKNVLLAGRLARHSAHGWDNPAIPDDVTEIALLLNLSHEAALQLVVEIER